MASKVESMSGASKLKRSSGDIGWEYGMLVDASNQDKWKCLKCEKSFSGGVTRIKLHIADIRGQIAPCQKSSDEDKKRCKDAIEQTKKKKLAMREENENIRREVFVRGLEEESDDEVGRSKKQPRTLGAIDRYVSQINPDDKCLSEAKRRRQQSINDALYKERTLQVSQYEARWAYEYDIPFNAVDNDSFKRFVEAWSDRNRRSIMNLCVNSDGGTTFINSKEASLDAHTGAYIFEYVYGCIEIIGEKNVVQVVSDNASNNMAASKLLFAKRPHIFWTPCATHSINLMLEAIGKLSILKTPIMKAKSFTVFIYSYHKTLALMRKRTRRNIVRPGVTRFASSFLTLQSLLEKKEDLKHMMTSREWEGMKLSKSTKGKAACDTIMDKSFWNGVAMCLKVFTPLVEVLRLVDGDVKPAMGFVYGELQKAKEAIKEVFKGKEEKYKPILDIVEEKGKDRIDTHLHLMAYLLNPYYYYNNGSKWTADEMGRLMDGVFLCMERLFPDFNLQNQVVNVELVKYQKQNGPFGRALTLKSCEKNDDAYDPVAWWTIYGNQTPNLQKIAKRVLALTTSSSGCERNWSVFEGIHSKKRNRLDTDRMKKLVYVQFNARLLNKKMMSRKEKVDVLLANEAIHAQSWIVDGEDDEQDELTLGSRAHDDVREPDEDDFTSDGSGDEPIDDEEFDFESDKEIDVHQYGNEEMEA